MHFSAFHIIAVTVLVSMGEYEVFKRWLFINGRVVTVSVVGSKIILMMSAEPVYSLEDCMAKDGNGPTLLEK